MSTLFDYSWMSWLVWIHLGFVAIPVLIYVYVLELEDLREGWAGVQKYRRPTGWYPIEFPQPPLI